MIYLGSIIKTETKTYISSVREQQDNEYYDKEKFIKLSEEVYNYLKEKFKSHNNLQDTVFVSVYIDNTILDQLKNISTLSVNEDENSTNQDLYINDISILNEDESKTDITEINDLLLELKNTYKNKATSLITSSLQLYPMKLYRYMKANSYLNANNYFITDDNRDEIYLKIINSEDETLVDMLLKFLDANDYLASEDKILDLYYKFIDELNSCNSKEEIEKCYTTYFNEYAQ